MNSKHRIMGGLAAVFGLLCMPTSGLAVVVGPDYDFDVSGSFDNICNGSCDPFYIGTIDVQGGGLDNVLSADITLEGFPNSGSNTVFNQLFSYNQDPTTSNKEDIGIEDSTNTYILKLVIDNRNGLFSGDPESVDPSSEVVLSSNDSTIVGDGFTGSVNETPLPAALPLFAGGLGLLGLFTRRKKRAAAGRLPAWRVV